MENLKRRTNKVVRLLPLLVGASTSFSHCLLASQAMRRSLQFFCATGVSFTRDNGVGSYSP